MTTSIAVKEERSLWVLEKVYQWKFPRLGWNDPKQELLGVKMQYHSRYDEEHMRTCQNCADDHADHMQEMEMDARMDAAEYQNNDEF
jgi:hypothetical protein